MKSLRTAVRHGVEFVQGEKENAAISRAPEPSLVVQYQLGDHIVPQTVGCGEYRTAALFHADESITSSADPEAAIVGGQDRTDAAVSGESGRRSIQERVTLRQQKTAAQGAHPDAPLHILCQGVNLSGVRWELE